VAEVPRNRLLADGALSVWSGQEALLERSHCFEVFEQSLSEQSRVETIRAVIRKLMVDVGCTFPFSCMTTSYAAGGQAFPWINYLSIDEYRQTAHDMSCAKSVFAQKAWWIHDYDQLRLLPGLD
jgi:hypothetical protein